MKKQYDKFRFQDAYSCPGSSYSPQYDSITSAIKTLYKQFYYKKIIQNPEQFQSIIQDTLYDDSNDFIDYLNIRSASIHNIYMVTINPTPTTTVPTFLSKIKKALKKKYIFQYFACIEQRNRKDIPNQGLHVHIAFTTIKHKKPAEIHREFKNTFKTLISHDKHINVKRSGNPKSFLKYIQGYKLNKLKKHHLTDKAFRKKHNLLPIYTNTANPNAVSFTCKTAQPI